MNERIIPKVHTIAVLRAIALGDFIIALPALHALRHAYPHAEIHLLGSPWMQAMVNGRSVPFDKLIPVPVYKGVYEGSGLKENTKEQEQFFQERQSENYDLAIQLHGGGKNSNAFIQKLGARHTAGTRTADAPELERWIPYILYHHEVHRWLEVMSLVGADPVILEPRLSVIQKDLDDAKKVIGNLNKCIVMHPGASDPRRRWPPEKFAKIGDRLAEKGYRVLLTGVAGEQPILEEVQKNMKQSAENMGGKLTLNGLIGVLNHAKLLISNDTGPLHLARAIGTPTVGIYWFPNMIHWSPVTRKKNQTAISWLQYCPECKQPLFDLKSHIPLNELDSCGHLNSYVELVEVEDVLEKALFLLNSTYGHTHS